MKILKPRKEDLVEIKNILSQWNDEEYTEIYFSRVRNEIDGILEFNMKFWIAFDNGVLGVIGLSDLSPDLSIFSKTDKPGQLKILYIDDKMRGKKIGKKLTLFIERETLKQGYKEILVKSAEIYKDTAWGFYEKMGYKQMGLTNNNRNDKKSMIFQKTLKPAE